MRARLAAALQADLAPLRERVAQQISGYTYAQATGGLLKAIRFVTGSS